MYSKITRTRHKEQPRGGGKLTVQRREHRALERSELSESDRELNRTEQRNRGTEKHV